MNQQQQTVQMDYKISLRDVPRQPDAIQEAINRALPDVIREAWGGFSLVIWVYGNFSQRVLDAIITAHNHPWEIRVSRGRDDGENWYRLELPRHGFTVPTLIPILAGTDLNCYLDISPSVNPKGEYVPRYWKGKQAQDEQAYSFGHVFLHVRKGWLS